jgi:hypothetical protein
MTFLQTRDPEGVFLGCKPFRQSSEIEARFGLFQGLPISTTRGGTKTTSVGWGIREPRQRRQIQHLMRKTLVRGDVNSQSRPSKPVSGSKAFSRIRPGHLEDVFLCFLGFRTELQRYTHEKLGCALIPLARLRPPSPHPQDPLTIRGGSRK